jgi:Prion-inhibition and propagation
MSGGIGESIGVNLVSQLAGGCIVIATRVISNPALYKNENDELHLRLKAQIAKLQAIKDTIDVPQTQNALKGSNLSSIFHEIMSQIHKLLRNYIMQSGLPKQEKLKLLEVSSAEGFLRRVETANTFASLSAHTSRARNFWTRLREETVWTIRGKDKNEELVVKVEFWTDHLDKLVSWTIPSILSRATSEDVIERLNDVTRILDRTSLNNQIMFQSRTSAVLHSDVEATELEATRIISLGKGKNSIFSYGQGLKADELGRAGQREWAEISDEGSCPAVVIVEFKGQSDFYLTLTSEGKEQVRVDLNQLVRVLRLARKRPKTFRVLYCHGWYESFDHFGLVYKLPDSSQQDGCECLTNILLNHKFRNCLVEELENRVNLAKALAWTLFEFHSANWVHKSFTPDNILFCGKKTGNSGFHCDWSSPYVVGFSLARLETGESGTISGGSASDLSPYIHPDRQRKKYTRFQKEHDMYSLGVVLLELGRPGSFMEDRWKQEWASSKSPDKVNEIIVQRVGGLKVTMGRRYAESVLACFKVPADELSNQDELGFLNYFRLQVCEKLEEIVV